MTPLRIALLGGFSCLAIYLFASAPAELPDTAQTDRGPLMPVDNMFNSVDQINATARRVFTARVVAQSKYSGLKFAENWAEDGVEAGPLPALFLRMTAQRLETKPTKLSLFLGSDAPINASNNFSTDQLAKFETIKETGNPLIFETSTGMAVSMLPDYASVEACVTCHNDHSDSPKVDWKLGDIMGATTWLYPQSQVSAAEVLDSTQAIFASISEAYGQYLTKSQTFANPPKILNEWPEQGAYALPSADVFITAVIAEASGQITRELFLGASTPEKEEVFN